MRVCQGITIRAFIGAEVIEPNTGLGHDLMRIRRGHLAQVERVPDNEVVNTVGAAEVEAEQLERP